MAAFWIRHILLRPLSEFVRASLSRLVGGTDLGSQRSQLAPAVVCGLGLAAAFHLVQILPAFWTDSLAVLLADQPHRQSQQNHFSKNVVQFEPVPIVIAYLKSWPADFSFAIARVLLGRQVDQIEMIRYRIGCWFSAAVANAVYPDLEIARDPNFRKLCIQ